MSEEHQWEFEPGDMVKPNVEELREHPWGGPVRLRDARKNVPRPARVLEVAEWRGDSDSMCARLDLEGKLGTFYHCFWELMPATEEERVRIERRMRS